MNSNESQSNDIVLFVIIVGVISLVIHKFYTQNKIEIHITLFKIIISFLKIFIVILILILSYLLIKRYQKKKVDSIYKEKKIPETNFEFEEIQQKYIEEEIIPEPKKIEKKQKHREKPVRDDILDKAIYKKSELRDAEVRYLKYNLYKEQNFVPIGKHKQEAFIIKTNKVESIEHTFLVLNIKEILDEKQIPNTLHIVRLPDLIVQDINGNQIALEIETGISFKKRKSKIKKKFEDLYEQYGDDIYIILTNSKYKKHYKTITKNKIQILVRTDIIKFIDTILLGKK